MPLPSLVVCPATLCGHWVFEVQKFVDSEHLKALNYAMQPTERLRYCPSLTNLSFNCKINALSLGYRLREEFHKYNLIVASYEIVRNDIEFLRTISWNYCILDEGHIIKNAKSKVNVLHAIYSYLFAMQHIWSYYPLYGHTIPYMVILSLRLYRRQRRRSRS